MWHVDHDKMGIQETRTPSEHSNQKATYKEKAVSTEIDIIKIHDCSTLSFFLHKETF